MAKTQTRRAPRKAKPKPRRKSSGRKKQPPPWYERYAWLPWVLGAAVIAVVVIALRSGGSDAPAPGMSVATPVVGADLHSLVVDPANPDKLFIGSHQGVSRSTDGGETWEVVETLDGADAMGWAFRNDAVLVGGHPGISVSTDGGSTFEPRNEGLPNTDIHALGAGDGVIYAASPGAGFMASTDGGETWEVRNQVGGAFMGKILVDSSDPEHVLAPDMQAGAAESTDGGRTWEALGGLQGAIWVSWSPSDTNDIVVTGIGSAVRSTDGGKTWDPVEVPDGASIVEFSPDGAATLYAAVHEDPKARLWLSTDGGENWEEL